MKPMTLPDIPILIMNLNLSFLYISILSVFSSRGHLILEKCFYIDHIPVCADYRHDCRWLMLQLKAKRREPAAKWTRSWAQQITSERLEEWGGGGGKKREKRPLDDSFPQAASQMWCQHSQLFAGGSNCRQTSMSPRHHQSAKNLNKLFNLVQRIKNLYFLEHKRGISLCSPRRSARF